MGFRFSRPNTTSKPIKLVNLMCQHKIEYFFHAHFNAQRGFYFDAVSEIVPGVFSAGSSIIEDPYWNYCFLGNSRNIESLELKQLESHLPVKGRELSFLLPSDHALEREDWFQEKYQEFSGDTWMVAKRSQLNLENLLPGLVLQEIGDQRSIEMACQVFNDAYLSVSEDGVGYSGLPPAYTNAFRLGLQRSESFGSVHLLGTSDGNPVAVASCFFAGRSAGIYNVAVSRFARKQGFGTSISKSIVAHGARFGIDDFFLQTEPESKVQEMYARIGFKVLTRGKLFSPIVRA